MERILKSIDTHRDEIMREFEIKIKELEDMKISLLTIGDTPEKFEAVDSIYRFMIDDKDKNYEELNRERCELGRDILKQIFTGTQLENAFYSCTKGFNSVQLNYNELLISFNLYGKYIEIKSTKDIIRPSRGGCSQVVLARKMKEPLENFLNEKTFENLSKLVEVNTANHCKGKENKLQIAFRYLRTYRDCNKEKLDVINDILKKYEDQERQYEIDLPKYELSIEKINQDMDSITKMKEIEEFKSRGWTVNKGLI